MGTIKILDWTMKDPLNCIGYFAGVCYGSDVDNTDKNIKRAKTNLAHGRLLEMPEVYVVIDGYSAKCIRELYTHIGGSPTRLQASTRYIDYAKGFDVVKPLTVQKNDIASEIWDKTIDVINNAMLALSDNGIPVEDYTNLLPLDYSTKMCWKVNLRCLINFMNMRLYSRAYWEIRRLALDLKQALMEYSDEWWYLCEKLFVPKCDALGFCEENKSCGRKPKKNC